MTQHTRSAPGSGAGTAITAAILSFLGVALHVPLIGLSVFWARYMVVAGELSAGREHLAGSFWWSVVVIVTQLYVLMMLLVAGIQLLRRRPSGRLMVVAGCGVAVALAASSQVIETATAVWTRPQVGDYFGPHAVATRLFPVMHTLPMFAVPFALVTLILVLLPSTKRWCQPAPYPATE